MVTARDPVEEKADLLVGLRRTSKTATDKTATDKRDNRRFQFHDQAPAPSADKSSISSLIADEERFL
jgi:hypothetical protein